MENKSAVLLVRVSTDIQEYEPQIEDLEKFANSKGFKKIHIIKTKESGRSDFDRKMGVNELFEFLEENREYKTVFITELSRLGRRESVLHQIKERLIKNKIQLYVKDIGYSLFDENGNQSRDGSMMFTFFGYYAESEMNQKKERFRRSKQRLMEMGYSISGPTLFGYKKVTNTNEKSTLVIHDDNSKIVQTIYNWYLNGIGKEYKNPSIKKITLECIKRGFPQYTHSKRNVNKLLKEEGYTGFKITNNKRKVQDYETGEISHTISQNKIKYPTIIDIDTFESVQQKLKNNNTNADKSTKHITVLSKIIQCPDCGRHLNGNYRIRNNTNVSSYRCTSRSGATPCNFKKSITMSLIDTIIWNLIKSDLFTLSKVILKEDPDSELMSLKESQRKIQNQIYEIDEKVTALNKSMKGIGKMKNIDISDFLESIHSNLKKLNKDKRVLENELSKIEIYLSLKNDNSPETYENIKENINSIENSRSLLKKYINLFVNQISILLHNQKHTILKIHFNIESDQYQRVPKLNKTEVGPLEKFTYLIIDKSVTQKINIFRTSRSITKSNSQFLGLNYNKQDGTNVKKKISLSELTKAEELFPVQLGRINLYQRKEVPNDSQ